MRKRTKSAEPPPQPTESRLGGIRAITHDEDERPSREDRTYGETIFTRGVVPMPKILRGRRPRER